MSKREQTTNRHRQDKQWCRANLWCWVIFDALAVHSAVTVTTNFQKVPAVASLWRLLDIQQVLQEHLYTPSSCRCSLTAGSACLVPAVTSNSCHIQSCLATSKVSSSLTGLVPRSLCCCIPAQPCRWASGFAACSDNRGLCFSETVRSVLKCLQHFKYDADVSQMRKLTALLAGTKSDLRFLENFPHGATRPT